MDSVTQIVLGASIAGAFAPAGQRRKALLAGAVLGTAPDLDVFIDYGDPVKDFTYHRSFSHSLLVLTPFSFLVWLALKRWWTPVREAPHRWLAIVALVLLTHPLLDAHTAYGTQLLWPLPLSPTMWGTIFVIDPLYTLPLLVATLMSAIWPHKRRNNRLLRSALWISTLYLGWSWTAQALVTSNAQAVLSDMGLPNAPLFVSPTPFNTLLWRVVVMTDDGYLEGFDSLLVDERQLRLDRYTSEVQAMNDAGRIGAVQRLRWFSSGFVKARVEKKRLIVSDLRMGQEPTYIFTHVVAAQRNSSWIAVPPVAIPVAITERALAQTWRRIWSE